MRAAQIVRPEYPSSALLEFLKEGEGFSEFFIWCRHRMRKLPSSDHCKLFLLYQYKHIVLYICKQIMPYRYKHITLND